MERKFWGLIVADFVCLAYRLAVRNGIKMKLLEGSGRNISYVIIHKFQLQPLKVFTLKSERFHS